MNLETVIVTDFEAVFDDWNVNVDYSINKWNSRTWHIVFDSVLKMNTVGDTFDKPASKNSGNVLGPIRFSIKQHYTKYDGRVKCAVPYAHGHRRSAY